MKLSRSLLLTLALAVPFASQATGTYITSTAQVSGGPVILTFNTPANVNVHNYVLTLKNVSAGDVLIQRVKCSVSLSVGQASTNTPITFKLGTVPFTSLGTSGFTAPTTVALAASGPNTSASSFLPLFPSSTQLTGVVGFATTPNTSTGTELILYDAQASGTAWHLPPNTAAAIVASSGGGAQVGVLCSITWSE